MHATNSLDHSPNERRIRVGEIFDVEEAKACMRRFRGFTEGCLQRLVFDLSGTQHLHTAGLGAMLYIRSCCPLPNEEMHVVYSDPQVGMILGLAKLDRWFTLVPQGAAEGTDEVPPHPVQAEGRSMGGQSPA